MPNDSELLRAEYLHYDRCVDIVSAVEVWFTRATGLKDTVRHFERYPSFEHPDGAPVTPDFTVLFEDETAYVGELSNLSLREESLDSLCRQIGRYDALPYAPGGDGLVGVSSLDVIVFVPHSEANAATTRIAGAMADEQHFYSPERPPSVLAWSFDVDSQSYSFTRDSRSGNPRPRGHGREHSLETWLSAPMASDTLRGLPKHFADVKASKRFMNDPPPPLYTATILWSAVLPGMSGGEGDVVCSAASLAAVLRREYGRGAAAELRAALAFLARAGLARPAGQDWVVGHRPLAHNERDVAEVLLDRYMAQPSGPVTIAEREEVATERARRREARATQLTFELEAGNRAEAAQDQDA